MKQSTIFCLLAVAAVMLMGCATQPAQSANFAVMSPAEGKALVYICRPGMFVGSAVSIGVFSSAGPVSVLPNNSYCIDEVAPGKYKYWGQADGTSNMVTIEVQAGEVKFLEFNFMRSPNFYELSQDKAAISLSKAKEIK
jgi:hypothetical protein